MANVEIPEPGGRPRVLADRYELGVLLGVGGMGRVYSGVDRLLRRSVAVKVLAGGSLGSSGDTADGSAGEDAQRLLREARAIASLDHPNVVAIHDLGWSDGALWIVMEHVEGTTLAELLRDRRPLPASEVVDLGEQVCAALGAAHRAGVVHRDVTPGNVLVRRDGRVKLTDFGIARIDGGTAVTAAGLVVGTPAYMSPEQVRGDPVDARSDLYSAGCCLYEMLTGRPPFEGDGAVDTASQRLRQPPPRPSVVRPGVPASLERVILTALARDPENRYPDAEAMRRALTATRASPVPPSGAPAVPLSGRATRPAHPVLPEPTRPPTEPTGVPPTDEPDLRQPDEGATRRRIGAVLILVATAALIAIAALVLYQRLAG